MGCWRFLFWLCLIGVDILRCVLLCFCDLYFTFDDVFSLVLSYSRLDPEPTFSFCFAGSTLNAGALGKACAGFGPAVLPMADWSSLLGPACTALDSGAC